MDDNIGVRAQEAPGHGPARQHHRRLHDRQRCRDHHLSGRRHHAVQGRQAEHLGRRHARSGGHSLAGVIKPGTVKNEIFASLDWLPTLVDIAGGAKGDALKKRIEAGQYPGIVKTTLDGVNQTEYLSGKSEKSARDTFFYYSGSDPSAVRYKNWKMYFTMVSDNPAGFICRSASLLTGRRSSISSEIRSRPRSDRNTRRSWAGRRNRLPRRPPTSMTGTCCPSARQLWLKELETYTAYPPLQDPASYNLDQVMQQIKQAKLPVAATSRVRRRDPRSGRPTTGARRRNSEQSERARAGPVAPPQATLRFQAKDQLHATERHVMSNSFRLEIPTTLLRNRAAE